MKTTYDFLIVGAGPAGAMAAKLISEQGFKVAVFDSRKSIERKICGEYLCPKGEELLRNCGFKDLANSFEPVYGMRISTPKGLLLDTEFPNGARGISVNRQLLDQALLDGAEAAGSEIYLGHRVENLNFNGHWCLEAQGKIFRGRYLIGADGRKSFVARHLGLDLKLTEKRVAVHAYIKPLKSFGRKGGMYIHRDGSYIGVDPIHRNELNVSLVCKAERVRDHKDLRSLLNFYLKEHPDLYEYTGSLSESDPVYAVSPLTHRTKDIVGYSAALLGDAAGFVDPLTGEGMYNAISSAFLFTEKLKEINRGPLTDLELLTQEYRRAYRKELLAKKRLNQVFQWILRRPALVEWVGRFLVKSKERRDAFIGIIGNVFSPFYGFRRILFSKNEVRSKC